jgi:hypothetical protein
LTQSDRFACADLERNEKFVAVPIFSMPSVLAMPFVPRTSIARPSARLVPCSRYARFTILLRHQTVRNDRAIGAKRFAGTDSSSRPSKRRVDAIIRPEWHAARTRTEFKARKASRGIGMTADEIRAAFSSVPIPKQGVRQTETEWTGAARTSIDIGRTVAGERFQPTRASSRPRGGDVRQPEWLSIPAASGFKALNEHRKDHFSEDRRTSRSVPTWKKEVWKGQESERTRSRGTFNSSNNVASERSRRANASWQPNAVEPVKLTGDIAQAQEEARINSYQKRCRFCCKPIYEHQSPRNPTSPHCAKVLMFGRWTP